MDRWVWSCGTNRVTKRPSRPWSAACRPHKDAPAAKTWVLQKIQICLEKAFAPNDGYSGLNAFLSLNYSLPFCRGGYRASLRPRRIRRAAPYSSPSFLCPPPRHTCASFVRHQRPPHLSHTCKGWRLPRLSASRKRGRQGAGPSCQLRKRRRKELSLTTEAQDVAAMDESGAELSCHGREAQDRAGADGKEVQGRAGTAPRRA